MAFGVPDAAVQEIKSRIDLADLIASYGVQVRRAGSSYKACCPFHHEKTPSFVIHPAKGYYKCFGCGEAGDCITFVCKQEGLAFGEAVRKLAAQCGVTIEEKVDPQAGLRKRLLALHAELSEFFRRCLLQAREAEGARAYLATRALPDDIVAKFKIGYAPAASAAILTWAKKYGFKPEELEAAGVLLPPKYPGGSWYNRFGGRLMFTITDRQDRAIAFSGRILTDNKKAAKYVNSPETAVFKKSNVLFALALAAPNIVKSPRREAVVCEGQIDVIRCHAAGFPVAVASQGTAFTEEHVRALKRCADAAVLVFDGDGAGRKAAVRTGGLFLAAGIPVRVATLPPGEDPDSFLRVRPPEEFQACLDAAESVTRFQVRTALEGETKPYSLRTVAEVSRAALETMAACPSAVMRAALMNEAAELLGVPVAALKDDFARAAEHAPRPKAAPAAAPEAEPPPDGYEEDGAYLDERDFAEPPEEPVTDAASPRVNPPPASEMELCAFLREYERDAGLLPTVEACLPDAVFTHEFTRKFAAAWRAQFGTDADTMAALRAELPPEMAAWLDRIYQREERSTFSELTPLQNLQGFARRLWADALQRRQDELPAESSPENDARRLNLSLAVRQIRRALWERAVKHMTAEALA